MKTKEKTKQPLKSKNLSKAPKTLGPVPDLERHLPAEWWDNIFNSIYLKTDGDVVENHLNTCNDIDLLIKASGISKTDKLLDLCCGQGRHSLELAKRGYSQIIGIDRSRYLIRLARKRARDAALAVQFSEGDARKLRVPESSRDCVFLLGNSFGYFEREEDDIAVLAAIQKALKSEGKLVLDLVDGSWMAKNFEPRSWEWIDQQYFVNRERTLSSDGKRIITREVVTHSEQGVVADQFYAERLYDVHEISKILFDLGYTSIENFSDIKSLSTRGQDLGMMAHRMLITCKAPVKKIVSVSVSKPQEMTVILGDPSLPDSVKKGGQFNEEDFETIQKLKDALKKLNKYKIDYIDNHQTLIQKLQKNPPKFVFNLCDEGLKNDAKMELHVPAFLEILGVPYSGGNPGCLSLCYDKSKVRAIASSMEVPVPLETYYNPSDQAVHIPAVFPSLVKPAYGDSSIGITQKAVVHNALELVEYVSFIKDSIPGVPVLIQEYLQGPEYSVGLIGNGSNLEALPILEVNYDKLPNNLPKILSYESKWLPDSPYWSDISYHEARISEETRANLINLSKVLFERLDCRDYARIDFRCDLQGNIKLLEVNPNPGWCWDGKFNLMAEFAGIDYSTLLDMIIQTALERVQEKP